MSESPPWTDGWFRRGARRLRESGEGEAGSRSRLLYERAFGTGELRIGEGVRELDEAPEGEGGMDPSSDPRIVSATASESSAPSPVLCARGLGILPSVPVRRGGRPVVGATRCFGASGGLFAAGWNSMIGRRRCSQLYCLARCSPRSRGIQVPDERFGRHRGGLHVGRPW
jgi:hypothetical protein